ncbi:MAG: hypothetical protein KH828_02415 [Clostridiales bacterium]|nr:hypothetical protein [Clostridiales bacterium]
MKRRFKYSFTRKGETEGGFASVIFAGLSLLLFLIAAGISFFWEGNAGSWIGSFGLMAILFSICGFFIGIKSFQEREKNYRFSVLGSMANGIFCVGWLALFLIGV